MKTFSSIGGKLTISVSFRSVYSYLIDVPIVSKNVAFFFIITYLIYKNEKFFFHNNSVYYCTSICNSFFNIYVLTIIRAHLVDDLIMYLHWVLILYLALAVDFWQPFLIVVKEPSLWLGTDVLVLSFTQSKTVEKDEHLTMDSSEECRISK